MKFAICNEIYQDWKLADAMAHAARTGYDAIEIAPFTIAKYVTEISPAQRQQIRDDAARAGIVICGIHWVLVDAEGMYLNHSDAVVRERTAKYFCDLVDFCADIGGKVIVVGSPKQRNLLPGVTMPQAWDWATETFRDSVKRAGRARRGDLFRTARAIGDEFHQHRRRSHPIRTTIRKSQFQNHPGREGDVFGRKSDSGNHSGLLAALRAFSCE